MNENNYNIKDDDFIIGKGFKVESTEDKSKTKKSKKNNAALKNAIWLIGIFVVSIAIAVVCIYAGADYLGLGFGRGQDIEMDIPYGSSASAIAQKLEETGAVKLPLLFRVYSKINGFENQYKYGLYTFNTEIGYEKIADMLMNDGAKAESVKVTIPEGTGINDYVKNVNGEKVTVKGIATILEEKSVCTREDFLYALGEVKLDSKLLKNCNDGKAYYTLEGYLFPDTYDFYAYDSAECARMVVEKMITTADGKITDAMYKRAEEQGYSMNEILTMASIIQMEAGNNTDEMKNVAAVFYNRLDSKETGGTLGSSPTIYYGDSFGKRDDGRYNTQKEDGKFEAIKGLPPGPLCSPGLDAINAALYPTTDSNYYYFVTDSDGNFYYHKTISEQNQTISKLQGQDNWIYEYY